MNVKEMEKELNKMGKLYDWTESYIKEHKVLRDKNGKIYEYRKRWYFPNGYGISVIRGFGTYGAEEGLFEIAVLHGNDICYDTPIADDVVGHLTPDQVLEYARKIYNIVPMKTIEIKEELYEDLEKIKEEWGEESINNVIARFVMQNFLEDMRQGFNETGTLNKTIDKYVRDDKQ